MRAVLVALLGLLSLPYAARAQEWTDTRVGNYDFVCETTAGVFVSGHQRFSLAARSCAAAKAANPTLDYQVRPASYKIALVAAPPAPPVTPPTTPYALDLDPTCSAIPQLAVSIGTAFVTPALASCYAGGEKASAKFELLDVTGAPAPHGWAIDATSGVISNPGGGPQASGTLVIRRTTGSGVSIQFTRAWSIQ